MTSEAKPEADDVSSRSTPDGWAMGMLRRARHPKTALAVVAMALIAFVSLVDATWSRPLIQKYIQHRSARSVDFDALQVRLDGSFRPVLRLRNLVIQNAPWASSSAPLIRASEFEVVFAWESLWSEQVLVTRMTLVDAELDVERQLDGLRNWRLTRPDDRGPGKVRVLSVDARHTHARVVNQDIALELELTAQPLAVPEAVPGHPDLPLTRSVDVRGSRNGQSFSAQVDLSDVLTLSRTGQPFSLRGRVESRGARGAVEGQLADLLTLSSFDVAVRAEGTGLVEALAASGATLPIGSLKTVVDARMAKHGDVVSVTQLRVRAGSSDLSGSVEYRQPAVTGERGQVRANLSAKRLDLTELTHRRADAAKASAQGANLREPLVRRLDGELTLTIDRLVVAGVDLQAVRATASLRAGQLSVTPMSFEWAGGRVSGSASLLGDASPLHAELDLRAVGMQLQQLLPARAGSSGVDGAANIRISMQSAGDSLAALRSAASGTVRMELADASMPTDLEAKLSLDGARWLRSIVRPAERVRITCSELRLRFDAGRGQIKRLVLETDRMAVFGSGWVDLPSAALDTTLAARHKQATVMSLSKAVHVAGSAQGLAVALADAPADVQTARACEPHTVR